MAKNYSITCPRKQTRDTTFPWRDHMPEWHSWRSMIQRCTNPNNKNFKHYGGRGITICDRWRFSFAAFWEDMGMRPGGTQLDRYPNNDGNYEPGNCRWATGSENSNNRRGNRIVTFQGISKTVSQWADHLQIDRRIIARRLRVGWPIGKALSVKDHRTSVPDGHCKKSGFR